MRSSDILVPGRPVSSKWSGMWERLDLNVSLFLLNKTISITYVQIRSNPRIPFKNTSTCIFALEDIRSTMLWDHLELRNNLICLQIDFDDVDVFFTMCHSGYLSSFRFNSWCLCSTDHGYTSVRPMSMLSCLKWNEICFMCLRFKCCECQKQTLSAYVMRGIHISKTRKWKQLIKSSS